MLRFTKRADYGLMAIHYIAISEDRGAVSAKRIADEFHIPAELLAKISLGREDALVGDFDLFLLRILVLLHRTSGYHERFSDSRRNLSMRVWASSAALLT